MKPENSNYCANVVEIKNIIPLDNCDNVVHANIFGNLVITSKETKIGDIGIYFPPETQLMPKYLSSNNLYRHNELNINKEKKGYFEDNGRIRCVKFRGHESMGLFMPLSSISNMIPENKLPKNWNKIGTEFDELAGEKICQKYVIITNNRTFGGAKKGKKTKISKIIDGQFRFHYDVEQLYKNMDRINPNDLIQVSYKVHGTSAVISNILCKKKLNLFLKFLKLIKIPIIDTNYEIIYSSRRVIKNDDINTKINFYNTNIWGIAKKELEEFIQKGMTIYCEICGFLPEGGYIQKDYDYGNESGKHSIYIYRITYTNTDGKIFEFSAKQVQNWCKKHGLNAVPELYYGYVNDLFKELWVKYHGTKKSHEDKNKKIMERYGCKKWNEDLFLQLLKKEYNNKDCYICNNKVPEEGIVLRNENEINNVYKLKSVRFYERETKELNEGNENIEDSQ